MKLWIPWARTAALVVMAGLVWGANVAAQERPIAPPSGAQGKRVVAVNVVTQEGQPVEGLGAENFRGKYRGEAVKIVSVERDTGPRRIVIQSVSAARGLNGPAIAYNNPPAQFSGHGLRNQTPQVVQRTPGGAGQVGLPRAPIAAVCAVLAIAAFAALHVRAPELRWLALLLAPVSLAGAAAGRALREPATVAGFLEELPRDSPADVEGLSMLADLQLGADALLVMPIPHFAFGAVDRPELICFSKHRPGAPGEPDDVVIAVVNLDPHHAREATVHLDLPSIGRTWEEDLRVTDELTGRAYTWRADNYVRLDPATGPAHVFTVHGR